MRKKFIAAAVAAAALVTAAGTAGAITRGGELDGDAHPHVALMVATTATGQPLWRCSGTFISPTVYVTAGHCVSAPAARAEIWLASDVESGIPGNGYPFTGDVSGTAHPHPAYDDNAFYLHDLGVVVLDGGDSVDLPVYGELPAAGVVDTFKPGRKSAVVTAVGYGLQEVLPNYQADRVRYQAELFVVDTNGVAGIGPFETGDPTTGSFIVSGDAKHGGTCFGDSGGPSLVGDDVLIGVTSFGLNGNCAGVGGVFRIDRALELDWIASLPS